jgi:hypothetical protein
MARINGGQVNALIGNKGLVYAAGQFSKISGNEGFYDIGQWNGKTWSPVGNGVNHKWGYQISALATDTAGGLYAAGAFDSAGHGKANNIARWNGTNWTTLGTGTNGKIVAMTYFNNNLYVAGRFDSAGGNDAGYIAIWGTRAVQK